MRERPRVLVVHSGYTDRLSYFDDWRDAFVASRLLDAVVVDVHDRAGPRRLEAEVATADLTVLLHSVIGDSLDDVRRCRRALDQRAGRLLAFVPNEVNLPGLLVSEKIALLQDLGVDYIGTQLPIDAGRWLYGGRVDATVLALPHALNPRAFRPDTDGGTRPIEIGVRTWRYLPLLGDDDRNRLFDLFARNPFDPPLKLDLSTSGRFTREDWAKFLNRCQGTISTEAGSLYLEPDDATVLRIREHVLHERGGGVRVTTGSPMAKLAQLLPERVRSALRSRLPDGVVQVESAMYERLSFDEVHARFFAATAPAPEYSKAISSRHFDAVGTKTCQIMIRGHFNGILDADVHYIGLDPDLHDAGEAVARFRDLTERRRVVDAAHEHVLSAHTYEHRVQAIVTAVAA